MELDFFTGYHGSGKTYTANELVNRIDAVIVDTGPIIRAKFAESGIKDFGIWNKIMEEEFGEKFSDIIVINGIKQAISQRRPKHLFIIGNRDINGIDYVRERMEEDQGSKILFFMKPFGVMKSGYERRISKSISNEEFSVILEDDEKRGLLNIRKYVENNKCFCSMVESNSYGNDSIELAFNIINKEVKK